VQVNSDDYGRDLSSVQTLLTKQETFDAGLQAFEKEGIQTITTLKEQLVASKHEQTPAIENRYQDVITRYSTVLGSTMCSCTKGMLAQVFKRNNCPYFNNTQELIHLITFHILLGVFYLLKQNRATVQNSQPN
jgi:hypothetical protein